MKRVDHKARVPISRRDTSVAEIVSIVVSIRVDKFYDKKIVWDRGLADKDSESYQALAYEANRAVSYVES